MSESAQSNQAVVSDVPDWNQLAQEVHCPLCGYNLRGLSEPRCPECGYQFRWRELLDQHLNKHAYLYEHSSGLGLRSLFATLALGWLPWRFWRTLLARHAVHKNRLITYAILSLVLLGLIPAIAFTWTAFYYFEVQSAWNTAVKAYPRGMGGFPTVALPYKLPTWYQRSFSYPFGTSAVSGSATTALGPASLVGEIWNAFRYSSLLTNICLMLIGWMAGTFITLLLFTDSMRRKHVRLIHVIRCVVYSCDCLAPLALVIFFYGPEIRFFRWNAHALIAASVVAITFPVISLRLGFAYRDYLRFDHPFGTVISTQIIVALAVIGFAIGLSVRL